VKFRLPSWLRECSAAIALLALAAVVLGPSPQPRAAALGAGAYLSSAPAAGDGWSEKIAARRAVRSEVVRALRAGRSAVDWPSGSSPDLSIATQGGAAVALRVAHGAAAAALAAPTGHERPAPRGPPLLG
jgi:hypothetical protein